MGLYVYYITVVYILNLFDYSRIIRNMLILNLYFVHFKRIDDLWNKCTNLQKYKSDTELEIRTLLNTIEEKETEIETLHKHLARYTVF